MIKDSVKEQICKDCSSKGIFNRDAIQVHIRKNYLDSVVSKEEIDEIVDVLKASGHDIND